MATPSEKRDGHVELPRVTHPKHHSGERDLANGEPVQPNR